MRFAALRPSSPLPPMTTATTDPTAPARLVADAICLYCSCMCDDISVTVRGDIVVDVGNACPLGQQWFRTRSQPGRPICTIRGRPATLDEAIDLAARILLSARYPLVYGLGEASCQAQRLAVAIADWIGGTIDTATSYGHAPTIQAFQNQGKSTCTLGEIRHRSDLVVFWGADPAANQPRLLSHLLLDPPGRFVPRGRRGRYVVVVDIQPTATSRRADRLLTIRQGSDYEALWTLRALVQGLPLEPSTVAAQTGVALDDWRDLARLLCRAQYGAILFGMGLMRTGGTYNNCEALLALVRDLNAHTRFVCRSIRQRGNVTGADKVVAWQTGYPFCVNLTRGYPRYNAAEYTTGVALARREPDAVLIVGNDPMPGFTPAALDHLRSLPSIVLSAADGPATASATVSLATSTLGIETGGTVYRMDEVPLALRPILPPRYPSDEQVLTKLESRIRQLILSGAQ